MLVLSELKCDGSRRVVPPRPTTTRTTRNTESRTTHPSNAPREKIRRSGTPSLRSILLGKCVYSAWDESRSVTTYIVTSLRDTALCGQQLTYASTKPLTCVQYHTVRPAVVATKYQPLIHAPAFAGIADGTRQLAVVATKYQCLLHAPARLWTIACPRACPLVLSTRLVS